MRSIVVCTYIEYLLYQEYLNQTHCNTLLQCLYKQRLGQKPKWPKHESFGALTESASVTILLHTPAAQPNSSTYIYPRAPAKESIVKYTNIHKIYIAVSLPPN